MVAFSLLVVVISLAGCGKDGPGNNNGNNPVNIDTNFQQGTDSLEFGFVENLPPATIRVGDTFRIMIELRNKGAHDIDNGKFLFTNAFPYYMQAVMPSEYEYFDLEGRSLRNSEGGYKQISFSAENLQLPEDQKQHTFWFVAKACYPYKTFASETVCINPDATDPFSDSVCEVEDYKVTGGQGAPLAVTKIEHVATESTAGTFQNHFLVHIENQGKGKVVSPDKYAVECGQGFVPPEDFENIGVTVEISGTDISDNCNRPMIDEENGDLLVMFCYYEMVSDIGAYTTPMLITLDYGYVSAELIKKIVVEQGFGGQSACEPNNCKDKSEFGAAKCEIYGGINHQQICFEPEKICCNQDKPDCERPSLNEVYECRPEGSTCAPGDSLVGRCEEGFVCCKQEAPVSGSCPGDRCKSATQCRQGFGGISEGMTCSDTSLSCCVFADLESDGDNCGRAGTDTENNPEYQCMNPGQGRECKLFLCPGGSNNRCCIPDTNCDGQPDGTECGTNQVCYLNACVTLCDYYVANPGLDEVPSAITDQHQCMDEDEAQDGSCFTGLCSGAADYRCCAPEGITTTTTSTTTTTI